MATKKTDSNKTGNGRRVNATSKTGRGGTQNKATPRKGKTTPTKTAPRAKNGRERRLNLAQKALIIGMGTVFLTIILILSLVSPQQGELTRALATLMAQLFGKWGSMLLPLFTGSLGIYLVLWGMEQQPALPSFRLAGLALLVIAFEATATQLVLYRSQYEDVWQIAKAGLGGGYFGGFITYGLVGSVGEIGAVFTLIVLATAGAFLLSGVSRQDLAIFWQNVRQQPAPTAVPEPESAPQPPINKSRPVRTAKPQEAVQPALPLAERPSAQPTASKPEPSSAKLMPQGAPIRASNRAKQAANKAEQPAATPTAVAEPILLGDDGRGPQPNWQLPVLADILVPGTDADPSGTVIREQVETIEHTLEVFGAPATVVEINQGPTVTQFGVEPSFLEMRNGKRTKVKVGKIAGLADDLALALHAQAIRIQAPVPGKGYVGIEVPNPAKALVSLRDVMETSAFNKIKSPLRVGLGQDVAGQPIVADLAKMPHLLIAGATGSGKSVAVNGIIACLLLQNTPEQLKLVMVDPKRVELTGYNGIPHLAAPVVVDMDRVIGVLQWAMREMDNRYKLFAEVGARNIVDYNKKVQRQKERDALPYIVIIIDELADLMMMSPEETERGLTRLAQLARATGMHMVIATQRPSVDVVTGLIKANFPARMAFAVASGTDSRVILDAVGAERLLGQGDMLYQAPDAAAPARAQGCFVSDRELNKLIDYWRSARRFNLIPASETIQPRSTAVATAQPATAVAEPTTPATSDEIAPPVINLADPGPVKSSPTVSKRPTAVAKPEIAPAFSRKTEKEPLQQQPLWEALEQIVPDEPQYEDELMPEAIELVRKLNKASTSLLQRRFRIGYTRAARMIDAMEDLGVVGPPTGTSKARDVLPWEGQSQTIEANEEERPSDDEGETAVADPLDDETF